ncbi:MAG: SdpI family protein [Dehalococcoidia bacterium]
MDVVVGLAFLIIGLGGVAISTVGLLGLLGRLPRNYWAGIRLPATTKSEEAWRRAHQSGGPMLLFGGVAVASIALAFAPFAFFGKVGPAALLFVGLATVGILLGSVFSSLTTALNAANAVPDAQPQP